MTTKARYVRLECNKCQGSVIRNVDYQIKKLGLIVLKRGNNVFSLVCLRNYKDVGNVEFV